MQTVLFLILVIVFAVLLVEAKQKMRKDCNELERKAKTGGRNMTKDEKKGHEQCKHRNKRLKRCRFLIAKDESEKPDLTEVDSLNLAKCEALIRVITAMHLDRCNNIYRNLMKFHGNVTKEYIKNMTATSPCKEHFFRVKRREETIKMCWPLQEKLDKKQQLSEEEKRKLNEQCKINGIWQQLLRQWSKKVDQKRRRRLKTKQACVNALRNKAQDRRMSMRDTMIARTNPWCREKLISFKRCIDNRIPRRDCWRRITKKMML
ncbi:uncharacterized protein LOC135498408 isoform X1 [Lineus longissimus]|uniref:uncharacterized protein LOC135498408 isoform X1 n=1 Tax=Lineus longissimus TaxID=88925 RepID=UPI00315D6BDE